MTEAGTRPVWYCTIAKRSTPVEESARAIAGLDAEHQARASAYERATTKLVDLLGRPGAFAVVMAVVIAWVVANVLLQALGRAHFDGPPFPYLQDVVSTAALFTTILILGAQRQEDRLAEHRARLTLALAVLGEQKIAKVIEMLEEQRRDGRHLDDRVDEEARAMSERTDPQAMIDAMKDAHAQTASITPPGG